jgi:hypothetical protein
MKEVNQSWRDFKALIATPALPALGPTPRAGRLPLLELNQKIDHFLDGKGEKELVRAARTPSVCNRAGRSWQRLT